MSRFRCAPSARTVLVLFSLLSIVILSPLAMGQQTPDAQTPSASYPPLPTTEPAAGLTPVKIGDIKDINTGDTAWMLVSAGLVLMMTAPGLALFYGGLV